MTNATITRSGTIRSRCTLREDFASRSTGNQNGSGRTGYYTTKGHAINAYDGVLQTYDLCFDRNDLDGFDGDEGRKHIDIVDEYGNCVGCALLMWFRMDSGRYEFTGYIT